MLSDSYFIGNTFSDNGTAVLLSSVLGDTLLYFDNSVFSENGTDIDNRTAAVIDTFKATFR